MKIYLKILGGVLFLAAIIFNVKLNSADSNHSLKLDMSKAQAGVDCIWCQDEACLYHGDTGEEILTNRNDLDTGCDGAGGSY